MLVYYKCDSLRHLGLLSNQPNWYVVFSQDITPGKFSLLAVHGPFIGGKYFIRTLCFISKQFHQKK